MKNEDFCYPKDFFYVDNTVVKMRFQENKVKTIMIFILYILIGALSMLGYYLMFPFKSLYEVCEGWCYH